MRKGLKKTVAVILTGLMLTSTSIPAFASTGEMMTEDVINILMDSTNLKENEQYAIVNNEIDLTEAKKYGIIFDEAYKAGDVFVDNDGKLQVADTLVEKLDNETFKKFKRDMQTMNYCLEIGAYEFNQLTGDFEAVPINEYLANNKDVPKATTLNARVASLAWGDMVSTNYMEIKTIYQSTMAYAPESAWASTVGIWVNRVRDGGIWDYKTSEDYGGDYRTEYDCTYGLNNSKRGIRTTEFMGNYNYGYTGRILFSLANLKSASEFVAGAPEKDVDDQPIIEEGFYDSRSIEG